MQRKRGSPTHRLPRFERKGAVDHVFLYILYLLINTNVNIYKILTLSTESSILHKYLFVNIDTKKLCNF